MQKRFYIVIKGIELKSAREVTTHSLTYLLTYLLTHLLTHLLTYSLTYLLTYSLTHLPSGLLFWGGDYQRPVQLITHRHNFIYSQPDNPASQSRSRRRNPIPISPAGSGNEDRPLVPLIASHKAPLAPRRPTINKESETMFAFSVMAGPPCRSKSSSAKFRLNGLLTHSLTHSLTLLTYLLTHSLTGSLTYLLTYLLTHLLTHLTYSLALSLAYSLTHSLTP